MNILSLFPAVPLVMMLGLWLSKSTRQIHTVMVAGSSLLVALAVVLVVQYLGLRGAGETGQMLYSYKLTFTLPTDAGRLEYLRGQEFQVDEVPFQKKYFS